MEVLSNPLLLSIASRSSLSLPSQLRHSSANSRIHRRLINKNPSFNPKAVLSCGEGFHGSILEKHGDVLAAFVPVVFTISVCHLLRIKTAKELQIAVFRSSIQLVLVGFVLKYVFEAEGLLMSALGVAFMVLIAGYTAGERAKQLPFSHLVATLSICIGTVGTLALMLLLRSFPMSARFIIPTAGYVIGGSVSMVGGTLNRLYHDIQLHQGQIEVALALGASPNQAVLSYVRQAVAQGMGPWIDSFKTAGLITLPGSMAGMLVVGSSPLEAVQMQLQVLYMLLGAATISTAVSCFFGWQMLFTRFYQLQLN